VRLARPLAALALGASLLPGSPPLAHAQEHPACAFVLGFAALRDLLPAQVGVCREDQQTNIENGDAYQRTAGGLLVWRKADNWTAFTDGYRTWLNGPNGLQQRLNTERFAWEGDAGAPGTTLIAQAPPPPAPAPARPAPPPPPSAPPPPAPTVAAAGFDPRRYVGQGDAYNCADFRSQAEAQAVLRADAADPNRLDVDRDRIACENNRAPRDPNRAPR
jgi:hypothetical protein